MSITHPLTGHVVVGGDKEARRQPCPYLEFLSCPPVSCGRVTSSGFEWLIAAVCGLLLSKDKTRGRVCVCTGRIQSPPCIDESEPISCHLWREVFPLWSLSVRTSYTRARMYLSFVHIVMYMSCVVFLFAIPPSCCTHCVVLCYIWLAGSC